VQGSY